VFMSPSGVRHGHLVVRISRALSEFAESRDLGVVLAGDVGFVLRRKPDAVRAPDVAFVRTARVASGLPAEFFEGPPDLAVEVMSPGDRWPEVERKAREFLAAGAVAVWAIDPEQRIACAYGAEADRHFGSDDSLSCPALLGDFKLALRDLWS
jgi:Uma2 family endonuclease